MADLTPQDLSHAMLLAVLMHNGGSLELPAAAFEGDALCGPDGSWHAVAMEPKPDGTVRIEVRVRPDVDSAGVRTEDVKWQCPECDTWNDGAVCIACDTPRPEPS